MSEEQSELFPNEVKDNAKLMIAALDETAKPNKEYVKNLYLEARKVAIEVGQPAVIVAAAKGIAALYGLDEAKKIIQNEDNKPPSITIVNTPKKSNIKKLKS